MDWTAHEGTAFLSNHHCHMVFRRRAPPCPLPYTSAPLPANKFIIDFNKLTPSVPWSWSNASILLALAQGQSVREVAEMLALGEQTIRDYRNQFLFKGMASLVYQCPPGRPTKLTKSQRQQLAEWIKAKPQDSGYTSGCWNTPMIQDLIWREFRVEWLFAMFEANIHTYGLKCYPFIIKMLSGFASWLSELRDFYTRWAFSKH